MKKYFTLFNTAILLLLPIISYTQNHPGGVRGSEVWLVIDWNDLGSTNYPNLSNSDVVLINCGGGKRSLYNFNHSISTEKLCFKYQSFLENTNGRDAFFVGAVKKPKETFSHLGSTWSLDSINRNYLNLNSNNLNSYNLSTNYNSNGSSNVNFYHTSNYNIDKKFSSYGKDGESIFYIGKQTETSFPDAYFHGNFPEFISFSRELSDNERQRVDSYLALKYGLSLTNKKSYLSSQNIIVWDEKNYKNFGNRIFGVGKDDLTLLNQLKSESTHYQKHLVAFIEGMAETNQELQKDIFISDNHFIVFGDNGKKTKLIEMPHQKIRILEKVWLAQRTGRKIPHHAILFKLYLPEEIILYHKDKPKATLWLIKDNYIDYSEVSQFDSDNLEYYPMEVNWEEGYAITSKVYFDPDDNLYDQFTFGIGANMIVQPSLLGCSKEKLTLTLTISGGSPEYNIEITSADGNVNTSTMSDEYSFGVAEGVTYYITVEDADGNTSYLEYTPSPWLFSLDLGADQILTPNNPEITINAGIGISDPDAIYKWYKDGVLLPNSSNLLVITEPGLYSIEVTSKDLSCSVSDDIRISIPEFHTHIEPREGCDQMHNGVLIDFFGGLPPYTINFVDENQSYNYFSDSNQLIVLDLPFGTYQVLFTDSEGLSFQQSITLNLSEGSLGLNIMDDLENYCDNYPNLQNCLSDNGGITYFYPPIDLENFEIDASDGISASNVFYEWFEGDVPLNYNQPLLSFSANQTCYHPSSKVLYTVRVTDLLTNCTESQTFGCSIRYCPILGEEAPSSTASAVNQENEIHAQEEPILLETQIYPNPTMAHSDFTYEVNASKEFYGVIEIFTLSGEKLYRTTINGSQYYKLPLNLSTTGRYSIRITTSLGIIKSDQIIVK